MILLVDIVLSVNCTRPQAHSTSTVFSASCLGMFHKLFKTAICNEVPIPFHNTNVLILSDNDFANNSNVISIQACTANLRDFFYCFNVIRIESCETFMM